MPTPLDLEYATLLALRDAKPEEARRFERVTFMVAVLSTLVWLSGAALASLF